MDISKVTDKNKVAESQISAAQSTKARGVRADESALQKTNEIGTSNQPSSEKVKWSEDAELAGQAVAEARSAPSARAERVAELKNAIKSGTYKVDAHKVADKMIESSLEEALFSKKA